MTELRIVLSLVNNQKEERNSVPKNDILLLYRIIPVDPGGRAV